MHRRQRKHATVRHIWIRSLLTLALLALFVAPAVAAPSSPTALPCAEVSWDADGVWPATLRDCQFDVANDSPADDTARAFLQAHHNALGLDESLANLRLVSIRHGLGSSHVVFQQTLEGRPVYGAFLAVHLDGDGQIQVVHNRANPGLRLETTAAPMPAVQAVQQARAAIQFGAPRANSPAPELMVLPKGGDVGRLVWRVLISAAQPQGDWEVLLDATTGQVIKRYNRLVLAQGQILESAAPRSADEAALPLRTLPLAGLDGSGWLRGEYVDVTQPEGYRPASAFSASGDFVYAPDDPRFGEVMVYYHVDAAQRHIQSLGYSNRNDPPNGIRDRVTFASAHWFSRDQSFYSVSDDALHFGDGGWPDALDPDIIVHEYGHALLHDLAPHWGGGDMESIGEGFGDYLAATLAAGAGASADPACFGEWDSSASAEAAACLRRVDGNRQYPSGLTGNAHVDGELWSRLLWDLRANAGQETADKLALESSFYLPPAATWLEAGQALLDADASLFGGAQRALIVQALQARGLAALPAPALISPTGGEVVTPDGLSTAAWQAQDEVFTALASGPALDYEVQWSLNASAVGVRQIDFAADLPGDFTASGQEPWQVVDGAARSGRIDHGQQSSLWLPVEMTTEGQFSFRYWVDSEQGYDTLQFLVDDQPLLVAGGQTGWQTFSTMLPAGQRQLVWRFSKDSTLSSGQDAAWIDDVRIEQASLALWQPADTRPVSSTSNAVHQRTVHHRRADGSQPGQLRGRDGANAGRSGAAAGGRSERCARCRADGGRLAPQEPPARLIVAAPGSRTQNANLMVGVFESDRGERRSPPDGGRGRMEKSGGNGDALIDECDDVLGAGARTKDGGDASLAQRLDIFVGDNAAHQHHHVVQALLAQQLHHPRAERQMRARQNAQAHHIDVFLQRRFGDHLRRLADAGVDHLEAGVAQRTGHHLGAAVPASRSARATTLAPRSWPSRPGLATNTRILRSDMGVCSF